MHVCIENASKSEALKTFKLLKSWTFKSSILNISTYDHLIISLSRGRATAGSGVALSPLERESYRQFFMWSLGSHEKLPPVVLPPPGVRQLFPAWRNDQGSFRPLGSRAPVRVFALVGPPLELAGPPALLANRSLLTGSQNIIVGPHYGPVS